MMYKYQSSSHDVALEEMFGSEQLVAENERRQQVVLLVFVNRSGSNYFAELLRSTGLFGGFKESLNDFSLRHLTPLYGVRTFAEYLQRLRREETSQLPYWGLKIGWQQLALLLRTKALPNCLDARIVLVERKDIVAQAVSYYLAEQTGEWTSNQSKSSDKAVEYDADEIYRILKGIIESYAMCHQLLKLFRLPFDHLYYEDLVDRPTFCVSKLTESLVGYPASPLRSMVAIKKQADQRNFEMTARFIRDMSEMQIFRV